MTNNTIELLKREKCTGCMACLWKCPKQCISKEYSDEGFWYPKINNTLCINCGVCAKVCPQLNAMPLNDIRKGSLCYRKEAVESASGGAFFGMAQYVIENLDGIVCGCILDECYKAKHICSDCMENVGLMQGSKYVQSDLENCFNEIEEYLKQDRWVLFSGTPCQCAALSKFIGKKNCSKLILIDLVCHGVPSPMFWENHAKAVIPENEYGKISLKFRRKDKYEKTSFELDFSNGKRIPGKQDAYYNSFLKGLSFRESCYLCQYATNKRASDITIGDCNTWTKYMDFHPETAVSIVLCNTGKGERFWNECKGLFETASLDVQSEIKGNKQLNRPSERKTMRDSIYKDLAVLNKKEFSEKYSEKMTVKDYLKIMFKKIVPVKNREQVRRVILKYASSK